ncbi:MAG: thiolase family protein [Actinobacteria bacterium]|nr:thiolase family protein [Actinomycetota bacterium]
MKNYTKKVYIAGASRTAIGNMGGTLKNISAAKLGSLLISEMLKKCNLENDCLSGAIIGNVLQAGTGQNPARQCALLAGLSETLPCFTVNKVCGSAMKAVEIAFRYIQAGFGQIYIAGGIESMSNSPYLSPATRWGAKLGNAELTDGIISDGLWCPYSNKHMGQVADEMASRYGVSRQQQDLFSFESNSKALKAIENGSFKDEIVPVIIENKKGNIVFDTDERPRQDASIENLAKLKPAFLKDGTITAGNSSGINDGAAMLLLASEEAVANYNLNALAEIISAEEISTIPENFGIAPAGAIKKALDSSGLGLKDIGLFEINEAFAAQCLCLLKEIDIDTKLLNVNGGAISLGHPIGASGARIIVTLLHEMLKRNTMLGLASLCIGSGEAMALIIKGLLS